MAELRLRNYQKIAVAAIMEGLDKVTNKPRPIIAQCPTAWGKAILIAELARRHNSALILSPTKEITEQNLEKLIKIGIPRRDIEVCSASMNSHNIGRITLATIGTVKKYADRLKDVEVVIIDECHLLPCERADNQYVQFLNKLNTNKIVGCTATPWKNITFKRQFELPRVFCRPLTLIHMDGGKETRFGEWFWSGGVVYRCGIKQLQEQGYLAPVDYIVQSMDWSFMDRCVGRVDYDANQLGMWSGIDDNKEIYEKVINWAVQKYPRILVFVPNIENALFLAKLAELDGISATTIDSTNDNKKTREQKLEDFRSGKIQVIFNVGVLTTGYDLPALDCVLLCRPTKSLSLYLQCIGRAIRIDPDKPDKVAQVIDLSGNLKRFGKVEDVEFRQIEAKSSKGWKYMRDSIIIQPLGKKKRLLDRIS